MLTPTILRGGSGSRRCPVTRELHPKPSIRRADGQCLLGKVFLRGAPPPSVAEILTITNRELFLKLMTISVSSTPPALQPLLS